MSECIEYERKEENRTVIAIREKIAEQICEWSNNIIIQKIYKIHDKYETIYEVWTPKISRFRPPIWKIFRWAYKIEIQKVSEDKCPRPLEIKHGTLLLRLE